MCAHTHTHTHTHARAQNAWKENAIILMWCGERTYVSEFIRTETVQENYMKMKA
jgi:hypothetical protein